MFPAGLPGPTKDGPIVPIYRIDGQYIRIEFGQPIDYLLLTPDQTIAICHNLLYAAGQSDVRLR